MPGRASETYLRPADSAASCGPTIVCTSATDSNKAFPFPLQGMNLLESREFHQGRCHSGALRWRMWRRKAPALLRVPGPEQRHTTLRCRGIMSRVIRSLIDWNSVAQSYRTQHCVRNEKYHGCRKDKPRC